mgnify:CR=1 FL=1
MAGMPVWLSTMLLGLGTVFVGLIVLIYITKLSSAIIIAIEKKKSAAAPAVAEEQEAAIPNRGTLVAVVAASIAEVMGKDISGLRIVSLKRVD